MASIYTHEWAPSDQLRSSWSAAHPHQIDIFIGSAHIILSREESRSMVEHLQKRLTESNACFPKETEDTP